VLFSAIDEDVEAQPVLGVPGWVSRDLLEALPTGAHADTAIVVDLPGDEGAWLGVWLSGFGFRPIPLYNAIQERFGVIDLLPIVEVLVAGAKRVATAPKDGAPAFLLDAQRMNGQHLLRPMAFDNRSRCWKADFPSSDALWAAGIRRALLIQKEAIRPAFDLEPVLCEWRQRGIESWRKVTDIAGPAQPFSFKRRSWFFRGIAAAQSLFFPRRSDGSYGMVVPVPSAG
jgi:hypothetical protein